VHQELVKMRKNSRTSRSALEDPIRKDWEEHASEQRKANRNFGISLRDFGGELQRPRTPDVWRVPKQRFDEAI
jgi:hypothetical protein